LLVICLAASKPAPGTVLNPQTNIYYLQGHQEMHADFQSGGKNRLPIPDFAFILIFLIIMIANHY
jgi:hypothetical protein